MNIGEVRSVNGRLEGYIATLTVNLPRIGLRPVESVSRTGRRVPAYEIMALNVARRWVQVGVLWKHNSRKTGEEFLAGNIADPSLPEELSIAFFPLDGGGYAIAWRPEAVRSDMGSSGFGPSNYDRMGDVGGDYGDEEERGFGDSTAGADGQLMGAGAPFDGDLPEY